MPTPAVRPTPRYLKVLACLVALMVLAQFLTAGLSLFVNSSMWACHTGAGLALGLPVIALLVASFVDLGARRLRWWTIAAATAWLLQVALIVFARKLDLFLLQGLHPFDGALLMILSTGLIFLTMDVGRS